MEELRNRITAVYEEAQRDVKARMDADLARYKAKEQQMIRAVHNGKMQQEELSRWRERALVQYRNDEKRMVALAQTLVHADERATDIINHKTLDVFAEAANFTAFEVSQDFSAGYNFILYDSKSVGRLIQEQPELLIRREVNGQKAEAWHTQHIANAVTQAIIQGESIPELSARIARDTGIAAGKASMLYARTAMTSAQNAGRVERMRESRDRLGLKIRKVWLSCGDDRVREAHDDLDGESVNIDEHFDSILGPIDYPGDPSAAPENVWNCRCSLGYDYPDYPAGDYSDADEEFEEWMEEQETPAHTEPLSRIDRIRELVGNHTGEWNLDQVQQVGSVFAEEVHSRTVGTVDEAAEAALSKERMQAYRENAALQSQYGKALESGDRATIEAIGRKVDESGDKAKELDRKWQAQVKANRDARKSAQEAFDSALRELRPVGGVTTENSLEYGNWKAYNYNPKKARDAMVSAMNHYPSSWLATSKGHRAELQPHWTTGRAYYGWGEIRFSDRLATNVHELGHRFEHVLPGILRSEGEFYAKRTAGEELKPLGRGYRPDEKTRADQFLDSYMGKYYGGQAYELFSMGAQYACTEYSKLAKDPDMESWVLGLFAAIP